MAVVQPPNRQARKAKPELARAPTLTEWDQAWADFLRVKGAKNLAKASLDVFDYNSKRLSIFRAANGIDSPIDFNNERVEQFLSDLTEAGLSVNTIDQHFRTVRSFLLWCSATTKFKDRIKWDSTGPILTEADWRIEVFTDAELAVIRKACRTERDRLIVEVLLRTGLRQAELLNLGVADFDANVIRVMGKGRKFRSIPIKSRDRDLSVDLDAFIAGVRPSVGDDHIFLLQRAGKGSGWKPMTEGAIKTLMRRLSRTTGIHIYCHKFRHTFATRLVLGGVPLNQVKDMLGHSTLEMVLRYAHFASSDLADSLLRVDFSASRKT
jgi:integrase/recombinase XerC